MNPFELTPQSDELPGLFGLPVSSWQGIAQFGANLVNGANARTADGHLANGTGLAGPLGSAVSNSFDQGRQTALSRAQLGQFGATTQGTQLDNQAKALGLNQALIRARLSNQLLSDPRLLQGLLPDGSTPAPTSGFGSSLASSESGNNPAVVNSAGYSGTFQFGAPRLADLGLYQPAKNENLDANQWSGTFNIPGFPDVKTHQDFLNNQQAQNAAFHAHIDNIDHAISVTPGADQVRPERPPRRRAPRRRRRHDEIRRDRRSV